MTTSLIRQIVLLHQALDDADLPHAFGGALALAWCTEQARGTIDIDVNVFVPLTEVARVLGALPDGIASSAVDEADLRRDGQARLWWDATPVDLFLSTTDFHDQVGRRVRSEPFAGTEMPFLSCRDLAVFKAFFDRTKDWADLEAMAEAGALDVEAVAGVLARYLGAGDHRLGRLLTLVDDQR